MKQSLPGIHRLFYVCSNDLPPDLMLKAISGVKVGIYTMPKEIYTDGNAECETETDFDNNSSLEKVTLKFSALVALPIHLHLAFVIHTAAGHDYLIGCKEPPYPVVKVKSTTGTPDGQRNIINYEVSFTARKAFIPCVV